MGCTVRKVNGAGTTMLLHYAKRGAFLVGVFASAPFNDQAGAQSTIV